MPVVRTWIVLANVWPDYSLLQRSFEVIGLAEAKPAKLVMGE